MHTVYLVGPPLPCYPLDPQVVGWREVPVDLAAVGPIALKTMPRIRQVFIESAEGLTGDELERELFIVRKLMEKEKVGVGEGRGMAAWRNSGGPGATGGGGCAEAGVLPLPTGAWGACCWAAGLVQNTSKPLVGCRLFTAAAAAPLALQAAAMGEAHWDFYACSLSSRTIVYKGMLNSSAVGRFFKDLQDQRFETSFAIYHRRCACATPGGEGPGLGSGGG